MTDTPTPARPALDASRHTVETVRRTIEVMNHGLDRDMFEKLLAIVDEQTRSLADMRGALEKIAVQNLHDEMEEALREDADWIGGYEECVKQAREALARSAP